MVPADTHSSIKSATNAVAVWRVAHATDASVRPAESRSTSDVVATDSSTQSAEHPNATRSTNSTVSSCEFPELPSAAGATASTASGSTVLFRLSSATYCSTATTTSLCRTSCKCWPLRYVRYGASGVASWSTESG